MKKFTTVCVASTSIISTAGAALVYDFENGLGPIADLSFGSGSNYSLAMSADGTDGLSLFTHNANALTVVALSDPSLCLFLGVGDTLSLGFDLLYSNSTNTNFVNWGFADITGGTSLSGFSSGSGGAFNFGVDGGSAAFSAGAGSSLTGSTTFVPDGSYFVDFTVSSLGSNQFQLTSILSGFSTSVVVQSYSDTITVPGLEGTSVHPMFGQLSGRNTGGQSMVVDNLNAMKVPEPSRSLMILCGLSVALCYRRRRSLVIQGKTAE